MNLFDDWLKEVADDNLVVDETETGLEYEARNNLWSFSINSNQAQRLTNADITTFLDAIIEARRRQLMQMSSGQCPMTFYCWHDEQTNQLRFSLVSVSHGFLPFDAGFEVCRDLEYIAERFLTSPYHSGLPMSELEPHLKENDHQAFTTPPDRLQVWTKRLP